MVPAPSVPSFPVQAFVMPTLRKEREGWGTHFLADGGEIKSLGHPL